MTLLDLHTHSTRSDGRMEPEEIAQEAARRGTHVGLTDHCLYYGMKTDEQFSEYLSTTKRLGLFCGVEIDIGRKVELPGFFRMNVDYIIGSVHHFAVTGGDVLFAPYFRSKVYNEPYEYPAVLGDPKILLDRIADLITRTLASEPIDILGHVTVLPPRELLGGDSAFTLDWCARVIRAAVANDVAIEISGLWCAPHREFLEMAAEGGATFSTGSDAHNIAGLLDLRYPEKMLRELGISEERLFVPGRKPPRIRR